MDDSGSPTVVLLDGDHDTTLQIAKELSRDLDSHVLGVGTSRFSRLFYSRYCDEGLVLPGPGTDDYAPALLSLVERRRPDVVLPVGAASFVVLDELRDRLPPDVGTPLPPAAALEVALDKRRTLTLASRLGIAVPPDVTDRVADMDRRGRDPSDLDELPFPLFLKARREADGATTARVDDPASFWGTYDELRAANDGDDLIVQELVGGTGPTYGCGVLFTGDGCQLEFCHVERRSVPPWGGSGTRLDATEDRRLEASTTALMDELDWRGIALAEYKFVDGSPVLMEINPKFWASYALASQCGYRFASTLVADHLGRSPPAGRRDSRGGRTFPLRELAYCLETPDASLLDAVGAMLWPPVRPAFNVEDPVAPLVPPVDVVRDHAWVRTALMGCARLSPFGPHPTAPSRPEAPAGDRRP